MTKLCFQYLAIFIAENVPNSIQIVPKWVENFAQDQINLKYIAKDFKLFAKVLEFRKIWSHWLRERESKMLLNQSSTSDCGNYEPLLKGTSGYDSSKDIGAKLELEKMNDRWRNFDDYSFKRLSVLWTIGQMPAFISFFYRAP